MNLSAETRAKLHFQFLLFQDYDASDLNDFEETILQGVGYDAEGKISRKELTMILLALAKPNEDEQ